MGNRYYILAGRKTFLRNGQLILYEPYTDICFLDALLQVAKLGNYATPVELISIEQLAAEIIHIQVHHANASILHNFRLRLEQE